MSIKLSGVGYAYGQGMPWERTALSNIDLEVDKAEIVGVIGPTSSGKSTLAQLMNGILRASQGQVTIDGIDPARCQRQDKTRLRQKVGLVFQSPEDQLFENRVYDDVAFGPRNMGIRGCELEQRVRWAMQALELDFDTLSQADPQTLSGGQKRRVAIAGVLAIDPDYLVLDEPGAGLDFESRKALMAALKSLSRQGKKGIVIISHRLQDVFQNADRVLVLSDGEMAALGTPRQILESGLKITEKGLDLPPTNQVLHKLRAWLPGLGTGAIDTDEAADEIDRLLGRKS